jgi:diguanylate cyclase (GGDEF)-like protein
MMPPGFADPNSPGAIPRNVQFANLNADDGISSEFVHAIAQDELGYIWFATQSGLNRYDGFKTTVYEQQSDDPTTLSHNFVWDLYKAQDGSFWVGTERGVNRYSTVTNQFAREPFANLTLADYRIRKIAQDKRGHFWFGTLGDGLLRVDPETNTLTQYKVDADDDASIPNNHILALLVCNDGEIWVGTDGGGLARFDTGQGRFVRYTQSDQDPYSLSDNRVRRIYEDRRGRLWVGTAAGGLNLFEPELSRFTHFQHDAQKPFSLPAGQVSAVFEDNFGTLWVGTESGLAEWRDDVQGFVRYQHDPADSSSLVNNRVNIITQDASGVLWIGTHNGVSRWNYLSDTFTYFRRRDGYLNSDLVTHVAETSKGVIWVGTYGGGLSSIDPATGSVRHYRNDEARPDSLPDDRVMVVYVDNQDQIWVGTRSAGLARMVAEDSFQRFVHDQDESDSLSANAVTSIMEDRRGGIWVGTFGGGLNHLPNPDEACFRHIRHNPAEQASLSGDRVLKIYEDRDGILWVGTEGNGLNRVDPETLSVTRINIDSSDSGSRPRGTPWDIVELPDRSLWLGTLGQGLLRWSAEDRAVNRVHFTQFSNSDGLTSDIYGIVPGNSGELWLSSNRGLFEFDLTTNEARKFDRNNGLLANEFSQGARTRSRSGRVIFGSNAGLVRFSPGDVPNNERLPVVSVEANSRNQLLGRSWTGGDVPEIRINYFDAFVAFDFVALDFVSPDKNGYRYRLLGLDNEWNVARDYRQAIYSSLSPGSYTFQVEASNNDGVWNPAATEVDVVVIPPPWTSWWAYLTYAVLAFFVVALAYNSQRAKRLAEVATRQRLEQLVTERTAELAERNTELMSLNDKLEHASVTDALTGLRNRRFVDEHMEAEISKLRRKQFATVEGRETPELLFLMMIDLDGFKYINDQFGHQAGDQALLGVKDRLLGICRKSDVVIRWGGDEFLVVGHAANLYGIEQFAEKIRLRLSSTPYDVGGGNEGLLSGSIGVAPLPFVEANLDFVPWEQISRVADAAAYLAKDSGRDAWVCVSGNARCRAEDLINLRENLDGLLEAGKLRLKSSRNLTHVLA